ncbi:segregation and condensation protein A [Lactobacillus selangorensis]|uniref:Segregation and condensation protein A n=1 Tax=Lactobacillus selangorensis TaxID=81857 RepID=A0A0R2FVZ4_9LACO|nr:segregation/condensation protein A [Lactobacillus selangorensis]KRN29434.1 segregation and condensation protein A [Lactobacillus selangorensis]KRN34037.1 segregation and condensation protein A [Lactobacillus selangorensis]
MAGLTIVLEDFKGPLDLLLHLITEAKIDIYDIPIAQITTQYLDYLQQLQDLQLDIAGDYLVMAAKLMAIKSKMLLPTPPSAVDETDEAEDPRTDLVQQLLAYQTFQQIAAALQTKETERKQYFAKPASVAPDAQYVRLARGAVKMIDITGALENILTRQQQSVPVHRTVQEEKVTVEQRMDQVLTHLAPHQSRTFGSLLTAKPSRSEIVTTLMAILELMKKGQIRCRQESETAPIRIKLREENEDDA